MVDDMARHLRRIHASQFYRANTLRINLDDEGRLSLSPMIGNTNQQFGNLEEAEAYVRGFGFTHAERVQPSRGFYGGSTRTQRIAREFEQGGGWVEEQHFRFDDPSQLENFRRIYNPQEDRFVGFPNVDENRVTLLRFMTQQGELDHAASAQFVHKSVGWQQNVEAPGGKLGKRLKGMLTRRIYEMESDSPIRVGVLDAQSDLDMRHYLREVTPQIEEATRLEHGLAANTPDTPGLRALIENRINAAEVEGRKRAVDGISEISERGVSRIRQFITESASELDAQRMQVEQMFGQASPDEYHDLLRQQGELEMNANLLRRRAEELEQFRLNRTGVFNFRALGLELESINNVDLSHLEEIQQAIEIKGNVIMTRNPLFRQWDVDVLTDVSNLTTQGGAVEDSPGRMTLNPFGDPEARVNWTRWDAQTASSYPEMFDRPALDQMGQQARSDIDEMAARIQQGEVPDEMRAMLRSQVENADPLAQAEARNTLDFLERGGSLADDPGLARRLLSTFHGRDVRLEKKLGEDLQKKGMGGHPLYRGPMPDTIAGEILPRHVLPHDVAADQLPKPGQIRYVPSREAWAIHESDAALKHFAWGGFDFDDMVNAMVRFDPNAASLDESIQGLVYRQPNVRGEWARMNIDPTDYSVRHILDRHGVGETFERLQDFHRRNLEQLEDVQSRVRRSHSENMRQHYRAQEAELQARVRRADESARRLLSRHLQHVPDNVNNIPMRHGERVMHQDEAGNWYHQYPGESGTRYATVFGGDKPPERPVRPWEWADSEARNAHARRVMDTLENFVGGDDALVGQYSNARMFRDHWLGVHQDVIDADPRLKDLMDRGLLFEHEDVIDAYAQGFGDQPGGEAIRKASDDMVADVYRAATYMRSLGYGREDIGIDPALRDWKGGGIGRQATRGIEEGMELAGDLGEGYPDFDELMLSPDSSKATIYRFHEVSREIYEHSQDVAGGFRAPEWYRQVPGLESERATQDARRILDAAMSADTKFEEFARAAPEDSVARLEAVRAGQTEFMTDVLDLFEDGEAGDRAYRATLRAQQIAEQEGYSPGFTDRMAARLRRAGIIQNATTWGRAQAGVGDAQTVENMGRITAMDIYGDMGQVTRGGPGVGETIGQILAERGGGRPADVRGLEALSKGVELTSRRGTMGVPEHAQSIFQSDWGRAHIPAGDQIFDPLAPETPVYVPLEQPHPTEGRRYMVRSMGDMVLESKMAREAGAPNEWLDQHLADALTDYQQKMQRWASLPGTEAYDSMPEEMRTYTSRAAEIGGETVFGPGDQGREAARRAAGDAGEASQLTGGRFRRFGADWMKEFTSLSSVKKFGIGGLLLGAGLIAYRRGNKDPDYTKQDMQGPANLPGGNPYDSRPQPSQIPEIDQESLPPPGPPRGRNFDVRASSGVSEGFLQEIAGLLGGSVQATERAPTVAERQRVQNQRFEDVMRSY